MRFDLIKAMKWALAATVSMAASQALAERPSYVHIDSITHAGSGCPAGTVAENLSDDLKAFTLIFDEYVAEVGPGVPFREKRKNCQINIDLAFPGGWSYAIVDVDYRGYAALDRGVTAMQKSTYYFQGSRKSATAVTKLRGSLDEDYLVSDRLGLSALVWSPCGAKRSLNINTQVRMDNRRNRHGFGLLTLDSVDGEVQQIYRIIWKRCRR